MKSRTKTTTAGMALVGIFAGGIALAHSGATGVVKERMDGMVALRDGVREVTPMMRGQADYDADAVAAFARTLQEHSGEAMTELFPEGSGGGVSKAQDAVWTDWEEFEALAMRLEVLGEALERASANAPAGGGGAAATDMMGMGSAMTDDTGMGGMMGTAQPMAMDLDSLAELPVDHLFLQVSQTCSACHTKYRAEGN
jgi:cytochrome c556